MAIKKNAMPARRDDLLVQKVGEEGIGYDVASHRTHSLNRTASLVFEKLDGHCVRPPQRRSGAALKALVGPSRGVARF